jgi:hypothetical protein
MEDEVIKGLRGGRDVLGLVMEYVDGELPLGMHHVEVIDRVYRNFHMHDSTNLYHRDEWVMTRYTIRYQMHDHIALRGREVQSDGSTSYLVVDFTKPSIRHYALNF